MFWNKTCYLLGNGNATQLEDGSWSVGEPIRTKVYCNWRSAGAQDTSTPDVGLMERGEVEFRANAYKGENRVEIDGKVYDVKDLYVVASGEFVRLTLDRGISNV